MYSRYIDCNWLVVYDNVESGDILKAYWPGSSQDKANVTTRNHSLAFEPVSSGLEVTSWDVKTGSQFLLFLLKKSIGHDLEAEGNSALALSERLSGHALGISSMAGLIYDGEFSIQDFLAMYMKNPHRAHATDGLSTLWEFSFKSLDRESHYLLGILSFLMPDNISQSLFEADSDRPLPDSLIFCSDGFGYVLYPVIDRYGC